VDKKAQATIDLFWRTANFISLSLLYLRSNPMLLRPLAFEHLKPTAIGHWGCVPALNFIWANLLTAIQETGRDVRFFLGTGHAGPAWISCSFLEGSLSQYYAVTDDEPGLAWLVSSFGRTGGFTTELSAQYPGVLWPSGELGYALGIAHGHSLSAQESYVVTVLGDGEMETAPTVAAFQALRKFSQKPSRLIIIVNLNGLRMGGPSELSRWSDTEIQQYFGSLGLQPKFIEGFDIPLLSGLLQEALGHPGGSASPVLLLLRTPKGATTPCRPNGMQLAGTAESHKAPIKKIRTTEELVWLENWLRSYSVEEVFLHGELKRGAFNSILPPKRLLLGTAWERICANTNTNQGASQLAYGDATRSLSSVFVDCIHSSAGDVLITSPDELSSNKLNGILGSQIEVVEYLSEHQCLSWSIGAATAARRTWYTSYDAFAPVVASMVTQYLKFLDSVKEAKTQLTAMPLNIFLTSLGWRNVYSHQDPGFASSILEKRFISFNCFLPASAASMVAAVRLCENTPNRVNCIIADKYENTWPQPTTNLSKGIPFSQVQERGQSYGSLMDICILVVGDYMVREAVLAAESLVLTSERLTCRVIVIEELSWLYRDSPEDRDHKSAFLREASASMVFVLATTLYADVVASLLRPLLPHGSRFIAYGYRSKITAVTAIASLFESECSWMQIASNALCLVAKLTSGCIADDVLRTAQALRVYGQKTREKLANDDDDHEWYWALEPQQIFIPGGEDQES
jgi:xylulose-5-phosphate/fructose-6-phosphate phosphoketolase